MKNLLFLLFTMVSGQLYATQQCNGIHTWHNVSSKEGQWKIVLQPINQYAIFTDLSCNVITNATITDAIPLVYGFGFSKDADFNIAYTLTAIKQEPGFESKACVFVITANGPAQPDITPISYHGALCEWSRVHGVGEDFVVG